MNWYVLNTVKITNLLEKIFNYKITIGRLDMQVFKRVYLIFKPIKNNDPITNLKRVKRTFNNEQLTYKQLESIVNIKSRIYF